MFFFDQSRLFFNRIVVDHCSDFARTSARPNTKRKEYDNLAFPGVVAGQQQHNLLWVVHHSSPLSLSKALLGPNVALAVIDARRGYIKAVVDAGCISPVEANFLRHQLACHRPK